jgi:hypothetical protein
MKFLIISFFCLNITFVDSQTKFKINTDNLSINSERVEEIKIHNHNTEKKICVDNEGYFYLENQDLYAQDTLIFDLVTDQFIHQFSIPNDALNIDGLNILDFIELRYFLFCNKYNVILKKSNSEISRPFYVKRLKS